MGFKKKELAKAETLGEKLKRVREESGITLEKVTATLKIPIKYLVYLEKGEYKKLPSPLFIKEYLKKYSNFLQVGWTQTKKMLDKELVLWQPPPAVVPKAHLLKKSLLLPKVIFALVTFLLIFTFALYFAFEVVGIFQPPFLEVNLAEFTETKSDFIKIEGKTAKEAQVAINGQEILVDEEGNWQELVPLQKGLNTIKIRVKKKFSHEKEIVRQVLKN